jgi:uncharacterized protein DUF6702
VALPLALMAVVATTHSLAAHPLHTSLAEMVYDPAAKEIRISIRVFVDDLTKASDAYARSHGLGAPGTSPAVQSPIVDYVRASFLVSDRRGRPLSLASCGSKPLGDLMWVCLRAAAPGGPVGLRVAHKVLFDLYADQINIVQAAYNGKRTSLLFTRGDGFKRLD